MFASSFAGNNFGGGLLALIQFSISTIFWNIRNWRPLHTEDEIATARYTLLNIWRPLDGTAIQAADKEVAAVRSAAVPTVQDGK